MPHRIRPLLFSVCALTLACEAESLPFEESEFRSPQPPGEFWEWGSSFASNGEMQLYAGASNSSIGCLIYTIGGDQPTGVQQVRPDGGFGPGPLVVENVIYDGETPVCVATQDEETPALFRLHDAEQPLFTLWGRFLFDGDVPELPTIGSPAYQALLADQLVYSFSGNQIFEAGNWEGNILATADVDEITQANPMRKLLFGALSSGYCGSVGIPEDMGEMGDAGGYGGYSGY